MTHTEEADVTVVIPAYQRGHLVARAVQSALLQVPRPQEVLVIDDGSTDETAAAAAAAGAKVINQENLGPGAARNTGLRAATTTWVAFLDSDDQWLPGHLTALQAQAERFVVVGSAARAMPSGRLLGYPGIQPRRLTPIDILWPDNPFTTSAVMVRLDKALAVGGFSGDALAEDLDFWIRLLETGPGLVIPQITCIYHQHVEQISSSMRSMQDARQVVAERYKDMDWFRRDVLNQLQSLTSWDRMRHALRQRDWRDAGREATSLLNPYGVSAVLDTVRYRAAGRRRR